MKDFAILLLLLIFSIILIIQPSFISISQTHTPNSQSFKFIRRLLNQYHTKQLQLVGHSYQGTWISSNNHVQNQFYFFSGNTGQAYQYFNYNINSSANAQGPNYVNQIILFFLDPKYLNQKIARLIVPVSGIFNNETQNWQGNTTSTMSIFENFKLINQTQQISQIIINQTYTYLNSSVFSVEYTIHPKQYHTWLPWILLIPTILVFISLFFVSKAQIQPMKISVVTLFITLNLLLFISLIQFYLGIASLQNVQRYFLLTGLATFGSSIKLIKTFEQVVKIITGIRSYIIFYIFSFIYLWCLFTYLSSSWFIIINSLSLLPQIIHNVYKGIKPGFYFSYLFVVIINQIYIIYFRGCPSNIFMYSPNYYVCIGILISIIIQLIILYLQHLFGSRFFIPRRFIPGFFNYIEQIQVKQLQEKLLNIECSICFLSLDESQNQLSSLSIEQQNLPKFAKDNTKKIKIMKTPCNHRFHIHCLQSWMEYKLECPIDRSKLPPIP